MEAKAKDVFEICKMRFWTRMKTYVGDGEMRN